jgi:hypothetical protein
MHARARGGNIRTLRIGEKSLDSLAGGFWNKAEEEVAAKSSESFGAAQDNKLEDVTDSGATNVIGHVVRI